MRVVELFEERFMISVRRRCFGGLVRRALCGRSLNQARREVPDIVQLGPRARHLYRIRGGEAGSCSDLAGSASSGRRPARAEADGLKASKGPEKRPFRWVYGLGRTAVDRHEISESVQYPPDSSSGDSADCAGCTSRKPAYLRFPFALFGFDACRLVWLARLRDQK